MTKKDKEIIDANPGATPYELKQLGLSAKEYDNLIEQKAETATFPDYKPTRVNNTGIEPQRVVAPIHYNQQMNNDVEEVSVQNLRTGITKTMTRKAAEFLARNPEDFKIL